MSRDGKKDNFYRLYQASDTRDKGG